jgi:hypothetical protein
MSRRPEMVKPEGISNAEWLFRLETERREIKAQLRHEVHTRGNTVQGYCDRLDRAIAKARAQQ